MDSRELHRLTTDLLNQELPAGLKEELDDALALGVERQNLWFTVQAAMWMNGVADWQFIYLAAHAYLFPGETEIPGYPDVWYDLPAPPLQRKSP
jgi:hypothetical protein